MCSLRVMQTTGQKKKRTNERQSVWTFPKEPPLHGPSLSASAIAMAAEYRPVSWTPIPMDTYPNLPPPLEHQQQQQQQSQRTGHDAATPRNSGQDSTGGGLLYPSRHTMGGSGGGGMYYDGRPGPADKDGEGGMRRPPAAPRIHWRYPALAVGLFVASLLFAVGHDIYYTGLVGQLADTAAGRGSDGSSDSSNDSSNASSSDSSNATTTPSSIPLVTGSAQTWALRLGTALAFLNKTGLTAVVGLVGAQQVWFTLRRKTMTVAGIDSMFEVMGNPLALLNRDLLAHAKLLALLATVSWWVALSSAPCMDCMRTPTDLLTG